MKQNQFGKIIVFSAASGAGKTTILDSLKEEMPELVYSISATTRKPRAHEKDGIHYFFMSIDEFQKKIEAQEFAEYAIVHGNYYGTPKKFINQIIASGKHIVMDIDVYGKVDFDKFYPEAFGIFIKPPSFEELEKRLRDRRTDSNDTIKLRLKNSQKETYFAMKKGKYEYVVVNNDLEETKEKIIFVVKKILSE